MRAMSGNRMGGGHKAATAARTQSYRLGNTAVTPLYEACQSGARNLGCGSFGGGARRCAYRCLFLTKSPGSITLQPSRARYGVASQGRHAGDAMWQAGLSCEAYTNNIVKW